MSTKRDYYEILGVEKSASADAIKGAYRKLAMKYHPDRNPGDKEAETKFKECAEAYEALSDDTKRRQYDQYGHAGMQGQAGHDFSHMNPQDIFSMFGDLFGDQFGGGQRGRGGRQQQGPARGYDLEYQIAITLEEVAKGCKKEIRFTRSDNCDTCKGTGGKAGTQPVACQTCGGRGVVLQTMGGMFRMQTTCPHCEGQGKRYKEPCPDCSGRGRKPKPVVLEVNIPAGIREGQHIRLAGEGEPGAHGGPRGDLHVVIAEKPHNVFEREGDDLWLRMPVGFAQAALGAEIKVPTIDGETTLKIPAGTQPGDELEVRGAGLPSLRGGYKGDLKVVAHIQVPKKLSAKQEELLREFAKEEGQQVREASGIFGFKKRKK